MLRRARSSTAREKSRPRLTGEFQMLAARALIVAVTRQLAVNSNRPTGPREAVRMFVDHVHLAERTAY